MSGTSLDGIDLVWCELVYKNKWGYTIINAKTYEYTDGWRKELALAIQLTSENLRELDVSYTRYLAETINRFKKEFTIDGVDLVCSHGHTVFHQPQNGLTVQIGNRPEIAALVNETVVCDFRVQDVQLGGQGAPLVPIGDALLFNQYDYCLNLGGFANISFDTEEKNRVAFDICPVNIVMNYYTEKLGFAYDEDGKIAAEGTVDFKVLSKLNELAFYKLPYPKSLGLEWVQQYIYPVLENSGLAVKDVLRTWVAHVAAQIRNVVAPSKTMLVTGGGAFNTFLMQEIQAASGVQMVPVEKELVMFKEALVFAFLGVLRFRGEINCLKSVTGARKDHSSGFIYKP